MSLTGEIILKNKFQEIRKDNDILFVKYKNTINILQLPTKNLIPLNSIDKVFQYSLNDLIFVGIKNKIGAINNNGDIIIEPVFDKITRIDLIGIKTKEFNFDRSFQRKYLRIMVDNKIG